METINDIINYKINNFLECGNKSQIMQEGTKLEFSYLNLNNYLLELHKNNIHDLNILLLISLETNYYEGENLKQILLDLKKLSNNLVYQFDILDENGKPTGKKTEKIKFKVNKIQIDNGDVLNRHRWIYRFFEKYMLENNLTKEEDIPENIKQDLEEKAYIKGLQQGKDWFREHAIDAINLIIPQENKLQKDFQLTNGVTKLFEGNEEIPSLEYVCYEYWLKHHNYKKVEKLFNEVRFLEDSPIEKAFNNTANDFLERLIKRNQIQWFPDMFKKYSISYLSDETIKHALIQSESNNNFELYFGALPYDLLFRSEEVKQNKTINNLLKDELLSLTKRGLITIRTKR
ncbi:MAG TPA: hypothetical protein VLL98_04240 [Rickettsiales bacterium]|nr:hypothetical protein [Rickettsiales bacterium]